MRRYERNGRRGSGLGPSRRQFVHGVAAIGFALAAGCGRLPGQPAPAPQVSRIGYLTASSNASPNLDGFREGLRELGYVEGQNVLLEAREVPVEQLADAAAGLVRLPVDVIVANAAPAALAASRATTVLPIVMATGGDPVRLGLADSVARPGRNVTGLSTLSPQLSAKRLELLREAVPTISRVAIMSDSTNPSGADQLQETELAARELGLHTVPLDLRGGEGLEGALAAAARDAAEALCILAIGLTSPEYLRVADFAAQHLQPSVFALRGGADNGGLMAYGPNLTAQARRAATYVDKILKGAKPGDLPIEQAREFDLVINLRAAQILGLKIPQHVLLQATEVLQ